MPVPPDPSRASWQEPASPEAVRTRIVSRVEAAGGHVERDTAEGIEARFGSRIRYRLWGLSSAKGRAALPVAMSATFEKRLDSVG